MDQFHGYIAPWAGFLDYHQCYHDVAILTTITQVLICIGTTISGFPQIIRVVRLRTSYGISAAFVSLTSCGHFLVVLNMFCLHSADFVGLIQVPGRNTIPRMFTFINLFILWMQLLPIIPLLFIFHDRAKRKTYDPKKARSEFVRMFVYGIIYHSIMIGLFIFFICFSMLHGFGDKTITTWGKVFGTCASVLSVIHYIPQFITTCKIKSNGALSIIMLAIQAPGGMINAITMMVGQGEHWTTYLAVLCSASQQCILLFLCIYYKYCRKKRLISKGAEDSLMKSESSSTNYTEYVVNSV